MLNNIKTSYKIIIYCFLILQTTIFIYSMENTISPLQSPMKEVINREIKEVFKNDRGPKDHGEFKEPFNKSIFLRPNYQDGKSLIDQKFIKKKSIALRLDLLK